MPPPANRAVPLVASVTTERGPARVTAHRRSARARPRALVVLLHGAGTDTSAAPLPRLAELLTAAGMAAVRFDQPYATVGGRRPPDRAPILDATLLAALPDLRPYATRNAPLAFVGRSSGARVACRTARAAGAVAVVCLGFPLVPPRSARGAVRPDRAGELQEAARAVPVLVLQGDRDPFGMPTPSPGLRIEAYPGVGHTPTAAMAARAAEWLQSLLVG